MRLGGNRATVASEGGAVLNVGAIEYHWDIQRPVAPLQDQPVS